MHIEQNIVNEFNYVRTNLIQNVRCIKINYSQNNSAIPQTLGETTNKKLGRIFAQT